MTPNRISGLVVAVFGFILLFYIIPRHTEAVTHGWLRPATLPILSTSVLILASIVHVIFPAGKAEFDIRSAVRAGLFFAVSLAGLYLMHSAGFIIAAPLMVAALMLLIGERRPLWLVTGIAVVPLAIWSTIVLLLNRPLF
jgi:putative tricarboxylic transport membrane protein